MASKSEFPMALLSPSIEMIVTGSQFPIPNFQSPIPNPQSPMSFLFPFLPLLALSSIQLS